MSGAKIRLSEKEMELVTNAEVILTKNAIIEKVKILLAALQTPVEEIINRHSHLFPAAVLLPRPKISRGENYKGLPYLILDYPRCFDKEDILAIRIMFWWGNYFSVTLHLSGKYKDTYQQKISAAYETCTASEFFIGVHENQWEHYFEKDNYVAVKDFSANEFSELIQKQEFLKLAKKIPLTKWDDVKDVIAEAYNNLVNLLEG